MRPTISALIQGFMGSAEKEQPVLLTPQKEPLRLPAPQRTHPSGSYGPGFSCPGTCAVELSSEPLVLVRYAYGTELD